MNDPWKRLTGCWSVASIRLQALDTIRVIGGPLKLFDPETVTLEQLKRHADDLAEWAICESPVEGVAEEGDK